MLAAVVLPSATEQTRFQRPFSWLARMARMTSLNARFPLRSNITIDRIAAAFNDVILAIRANHEKGR